MGKNGVFKLRFWGLSFMKEMGIGRKEGREGERERKRKENRERKEKRK